MLRRLPGQAVEEGPAKAIATSVTQVAGAMTMMRGAEAVVKVVGFAAIGSEMMSSTARVSENRSLASYSSAASAEAGI